MPVKKSEPTTETFKVRGEEMMKKLRELLKEGSVRRIVISDKSGKVLLNIPLAFGLVGALVSPVLAVASAALALVTECSITIERKD